MIKILVQIGMAVALMSCGTGSTTVKCIEGQEMAIYATFGTKYAEVYCDLRSDCDEAQFEVDFDGDMEACKRVVVNQENKHATTQICDRDCVFGEEPAEVCLSVAESLKCENWASGELNGVCSSMMWECPES